MHSNACFFLKKKIPLAPSYSRFKFLYDRANTIIKKNSYKKQPCFHNLFFNKESKDYKRFLFVK